MKKIIGLFFILFVSLVLVGCDKEKDQNTLRLITPTAQNNLDIIAPAFEKATGIKLEAVSKQTGAVVTEIRNTAKNPTYDVVWLPEANVIENKDLFIDYTSKHIDLYDKKIVSSSKVATNINYAIPVILYNKSGVKELAIEVNGYESILNEKLKGKIAFGKITSSSTYNHVENMLLAMGKGETNDQKIESTEAWDYVEKFLKNLDKKDGISSSAMLSGVASKEYLIAMSYDTQGQMALENVDGSYNDVGVVFMEEGVVAKNSSVAAIKGGREDLAKKFIDWISSQEGQDILGLECSGANPLLSTAKTAHYKVKISEINVLAMDIGWSADKKVGSVTKFNEIYKPIFA